MDTNVSAGDSAVIAVYGTHSEAEQAIKKLQRSGFDMKQLSILGKGYHSEERPYGFYTTGDRMKTWGGLGAFWGSLWGLLFGAAFFWLPGIGPVAAAGCWSARSRERWWSVAFPLWALRWSAWASPKTASSNTRASSRPTSIS